MKWLVRILMKTSNETGSLFGDSPIKGSLTVIPMFRACSMKPDTPTWLSVIFIE
jgi:hypothetical protein